MFAIVIEHICTFDIYTKITLFIHNVAFRYRHSFPKESRLLFFLMLTEQLKRQRITQMGSLLERISSFLLFVVITQHIVDLM